jgi:hypothetical protein
VLHPELIHLHLTSSLLPGRRSLWECIILCTIVELTCSILGWFRACFYINSQFSVLLLNAVGNRNTGRNTAWLRSRVFHPCFHPIRALCLCCPSLKERSMEVDLISSTPIHCCVCLSLHQYQDVFITVAVYRGSPTMVWHDFLPWWWKCDMLSVRTIGENLSGFFWWPGIRTQCLSLHGRCSVTWTMLFSPC